VQKRGYGMRGEQMMGNVANLDCFRPRVHEHGATGLYSQRGLVDQLGSSSRNPPASGALHPGVGWAALQDDGACGRLYHPVGSNKAE
jgi:hypothetical protein